MHCYVVIVQCDACPQQVVVGLDPGMRDVYVAVQNDDSELQHQLHRCPIAMYQRACGFPAAAIQRAKELKANPNIEKRRSKIPTRMTTNIFKVMEHVRYCTRHLAAEVAFTCGASQERNRQFVGRVRKASALAALAHAITRRHREGCNLAFGNANPGHGSCISRVGMGLPRRAQTSPWRPPEYLGDGRQRVLHKPVLLPLRVGRYQPRAGALAAHPRACKLLPGAAVHLVRHGMSMPVDYAFDTLPQHPHRSGTAT